REGRALWMENPYFLQNFAPDISRDRLDTIKSFLSGIRPRFHPTECLARFTSLIKTKGSSSIRCSRLRQDDDSAIYEACVLRIVESGISDTTLCRIYSLLSFLQVLGDYFATQKIDATE